MAVRTLLLFLTIVSVSQEASSDKITLDSDPGAKQVEGESLHSIHRRDIASPCLKNTFQKGRYCVPVCGAGLYGNTQTRTCEKCASQCKSCYDAKVNNKCSGCRAPLYLQGQQCVTSCTGGWSKGPPSMVLRLVGGQNQFEGRVEVFHNGEWGTVCDDSWDMKAAKVVCRELMLGDALEAVTLGRMGRGKSSQIIWLDNVKCLGNESNLEQCQHAEWGKHNCGHFEDAGVRCLGPDSTRQCVADCGEGYYQIPSKKKGVPKESCGVCSSSCRACANSATNCTKCDKPRFLKGGFCVTFCGDGFYGDTSDRKCKPCDSSCRTCKDGNSARICTGCYDIRFLIGSKCVSNCGSTMVGLKRRVRLAGTGRTAYSGRVEIRVGYSWQTVCDRTWDLRDAQVVCRWLGLGRALKAVPRSGFGRGSGGVFKHQLNCLGTEATLSECPQVPVSWLYRCYHNNDAGVICSGPQTGSLQSNKCVRQCPLGMYKDFRDQCRKCAAGCAFCINNSLRCIGCKAPYFLKGTSCVTRCGSKLYGDTVKRKCLPCLAEKCASCADGKVNSNCTSCAAPKALMNGQCVDKCSAGLYKLGGNCVSDCGIGYYKFDGNYSCVVCPSSCVNCVYKGDRPSCTDCLPPKVLDGGSCLPNCTAGKFAVPVTQKFKTKQTVRLVNGSDYLEGLLQVFHNGIWGTVCDDSWGIDDVTVVCRQLNLGKPGGQVKRKDIPRATGKIWLDDVHCRRNQLRLQDCRHRPWGSTNCNHIEDVKLRCSGPGVRKCTTNCPDGFYADGNECLKCDVTCMTCTGSATTCNKCAKGYVMNHTSCVSDCGKGYYADKQTNTCRPCSVGCATCAKAGRCSSCSAPKYLQDDGSCDNGCGSSLLPVGSTVRLVNGKNSLEGRVEIMYNGEYGTVCDDGWGINDAKVVCRMLNLGNATAFLGGAYFGQGTGKTLLDDVDCKGNEKSLARCKHRGWGVEDCSHSEDAGVRCSGPDISRSCIKPENCQEKDGFFITGSGNARKCGKCGFCATCKDNPEYCTSCPKGGYLTSNKTCVQVCGPGEYVAVINGRPTCKPCDPGCGGCKGTPDNCIVCGEGKFLKGNKCVSQCDPTDLVLSGVPDIRLAGRRGNNTFIGRVEILVRGEWGTVCDDGWDMLDAQVVCRHLQYGRAIKAVTDTGRFGQGTGKVWMDDVACNGSESRLQNCKMLISDFGRGNCGHYEDAGVVCSGPDYSRRCADSCKPGQYVVNKVCKPCASTCKTCDVTDTRCTGCSSPFFLDQHANQCVLKCPVGSYGNTDTNKCQPCSSSCLTCADGKVGSFCRACYDKFVLKGTKCLRDCGNMTVMSSILTKPSQFPTVRLANGSSKYEGRVEVLHDGVWGTVCDDGWSLTNGHVVCKELGLGRAKAVYFGGDKFGKGTGPIWLDNVQCRGYETSISQCKHNGLGVTNCHPGHHEDAGVSCDNSTLEEISNNYCREINDGPCDRSRCYGGVTCIPLNSNAPPAEQQSVCLQCPDGTIGDGRTCRLIGSKAPVFLNSPTNKTLREGQALQLRCSSTATPRIVYPVMADWLKDGKPLPIIGSSRRIVLSLGRLTINSIRREDSGNYTCTLVNTAGSVTKSAMVVVEEYPHIVYASTPKAILGEPATLVCGASSYPPANITWKFNNKELLQDDKYAVSQANKSLTILKATLSDSGDYVCVATNKLGSAELLFNLVVGDIPMITTAPKGTVTRIGGEAKFTCDVSAEPPAVITWKKDGVALSNNSRAYVTSSSYFVSLVNQSDVGFYRCIASNRFGTVSRWATLLIKGKPKIEEGPKEISVFSGTNVTFYCRYLGSPQPTQEWLKNGEAVRDSDRVDTKPPGQLRIYRVTVEDSGKYTCVVRNKFGQDSSSADLVVDGQVNTAAKQKTSKALSTGAIVAIVVIFTAVLVIILVVILYKCFCAGSRQYHYAVGNGGAGRFASMKSRMRSAVRNPRSVHYQGGNKDEIEFYSDTKPFVDEPL